MPLYESIIIARQEVSAQAAEALADKFAAILTENKGTIAKREYWGLRSLAYKIKKNRKGHYFLFNIESPFEAIEEMERNLRLDEDILRYMTLRVEEHEEEPSVVMRNRGREDEDERPRRSFDDKKPAESTANAAPVKAPAEAPVKTPAEAPASEETPAPEGDAS